MCLFVCFIVCLIGCLFVWLIDCLLDCLFACVNYCVLLVWLFVVCADVLAPAALFKLSSCLEAVPAAEMPMEAGVCMIG